MRPPLAADRPSQGWRLPWRLAATMKDDHVATLADGPLAEPGRRLVSRPPAGRHLLAGPGALGHAQRLLPPDRPALRDLPPGARRLRDAVPGPGRRAAGPGADLVARPASPAPGPVRRDAVRSRPWPAPSPRRPPARSARRTDRPRLAVDGRRSRSTSRLRRPDEAAAGARPGRPGVVGRPGRPDRRLARRDDDGPAGLPGDQPAGLAPTRRGAPARRRARPPARGPAPRRPVHRGGGLRRRRPAAFGYAWVPAETDLQRPPASTGAVSAKDRVLRNESIAVEIDATTGGMRSVAAVGEPTPRLGQQLVVTGWSTRPASRSLPRCAATGSRSITAAPRWCRRPSAGRIRRPAPGESARLVRAAVPALDRPADPGARDHPQRPRRRLARACGRGPIPGRSTWPAAGPGPTPARCSAAPALGPRADRGRPARDARCPRHLDPDPADRAPLRRPGPSPQARRPGCSTRCCRRRGDVPVVHARRRARPRAPVPRRPRLRHAAGRRSSDRGRPARPGLAGWLVQIDHKTVAITRVEFAENAGERGWGLVFHLLETAGRRPAAGCGSSATPTWARQTDFNDELIVDLPSTATPSRST